MCIRDRWSSGEPLADIADALGIHVATVTRYLDEVIEDEADGEEEMTELPSPGLVPLELPLASLGGPSVRVTTPGGFVVDGLDADAAAALILALR